MSFNYINTKGRNDLVIHHAAHAKSPAAVIIEAKSPANSAEMPRPDRLNTKALQELLLYYLRERITFTNLELRHLVITNVHEWYIFDARDFERCFARDKDLLRLFDDFEAKRLAGQKTDHFYSQIAQRFLEEALPHLPVAYVDLSGQESGQRKEVRGQGSISERTAKSKINNQQSAIPNFKILSPSHLLKLPFTNDSNSLDKGFYSELLHIIGLTERKDGGKKLIEREPEGERDPGSLIENAIAQLDSLDKLAYLPNPKRFGADKQERLFNVALELAITWTNRILFLKLLEAQLLAYHKGDRDYAFLHSDKVPRYDELNNLFFQVLARVPAERSPELRLLFAKVPYLNSSLFKPSEIEHLGLTVSQINDKPLPLHPATVLKDTRGKKRGGELIALKSELGLLCDREGRRLKNHHIEVVNDELIVTDEDGDFFEYKPRLPASRRVPEALFHEKQTLIENCLFGVDLNPNSVKICRLRLWIELLKNAYYKNDEDLETLPNIDINIKCGNSLVSRFGLDADLKSALRKSKWDMNSYRMAVKQYRHAESKEHKRAMEKLIADIKGDFETVITEHDPRMVKLDKLKGIMLDMVHQPQLFKLSKTEKAAWDKKRTSTQKAITKLENEIEDIKNSQMYENAFEWRFEFPEVLDDDGKFTGFDALIGNPPYVQIQKLPDDVKAGLNDAFVIDQKIRDQLIHEDPNSAELIKPYLRGRDVKKWNVSETKEYLINLVSSENRKYPWTDKTDHEAEEIFKSSYPAISSRLLSEPLRSKLVKRSDQGKYFWELRSCAYWEEFDQRKIVFRDIASSNEFAFDLTGSYMGNTGYILPTDELWLCAFLNSKITLWFFHQTSPLLQGGFLRWIAQYVTKIPIPPATAVQIGTLCALAVQGKEYTARQDLPRLKKIQSQIDEIVCEMFGLTEDERETILNSFTL